MTKKILITGGCGFIGHHFVEHVHRKTKWDIIVIDKLSYASGGLNRLRDSQLLTSSRITIFPIDLCLPLSSGVLQEIGDVDYIVHMAAETHVDNSIKEPIQVITNNVLSTLHILEYARKQKNLEKFFYFSTDEVYGAAPNTVAFKEWDVHRPTNPYSASKSAAENICISYQNTYDIPIVVMNVMNAIGERQHVEKFLPMLINNILNDKITNIHANKSLSMIGSRYYIHCRNISDAVLFLIDKGVVGEKYNVAGEQEVSNLELGTMVASIIKKDFKYIIVDAETDRKGHDLRYCLSGEKLTKLGWTPPMGFKESLERTVLWTISNQQWLKW